jgi:hypothetical protein
LHQSTPNSSNTAVPSSISHNHFQHQQNQHVGTNASSNAYISMRPLRISGGRDMMTSDTPSSSTNSSSRRRSKGIKE